MAGGTRYDIGIFSSVYCSATAINKIVEWFTPERLAAYTNVDDVIAFAHTSGCGMSSPSYHVHVLRRTNEAGIAMVKEMLPAANAVEPWPVAASHIKIGLECGSSGGFSGISVNAALGAAMEILVRHSGTAILSETPEIHGVESMLTGRAVSPEVRQKLLDRLKSWKE